MKPTFQEEPNPAGVESANEQERQAYVLGRVLLGAWTIPVILLVASLFIAPNRVLAGTVTAVVTAILLIASLLAYWRRYQGASLVLVATLLLVGLYINYLSAGEARPGMIYFAWITVTVGLLVGSRAALITAFLFVAEQFLLTRLSLAGRLTPATTIPSGYTGAFIISVGYILIAGTFGLAANSIQRVLNRANLNENQLAASNKKLEELTHTLELRVEDRTAQLQTRVNQFEAISAVARSIASIQNLEELLPSIARLVSNRFGYYHTGIFLLSENNDFAVLRATNSEGGQRMLERNHQLRLDSNSIVGFAASQAEARIALDVGADSVFFNNPDLPQTRSEMALPLRVGRQVIGVLDVQSTQPNAFTQDDIAALDTLADQIAIAIENARLFSESRKALAEAERTFELYIKQEWGAFARTSKSPGYVFDGTRTLPLRARNQQEKARSLAQTGRLSLEKDTGEVTIPIKFRGQTVGFLDVKSKKGNRRWTRDELALLESAAERAALALENARLVETAQRRASRERTIGEISSRIGAVSNLDAIMQTAVEELGRRIGSAAEVTIEITADEQK